MRKRNTFLIGTATLFVCSMLILRPPVGQWLLARWELMTGQYVIQYDTTNGIREIRIPITRDQLEEAALLEEKTRSLWGQIDTERNYQLQQKEQDHIFKDAWNETVEGYVRVSEFECPSWEDCHTVRVANFVVSGAASPRLAQYLGVPVGGSIVIPLGCMTHGGIRYLSYEDVRAKSYEYIRGEQYRLLVRSSELSPVTLQFEKPYRPDDFGTEGLSCMTPFGEFQVTPEHR